MTLGRIRTADGFYCSSCKHSITDFRDKSAAEILEQISVRPVCGIFNEEQVQQPSYSYTKRFLLKVLTLFAILGFQVKPLSAQEIPSATKDSISIQKRSTVNKDIPTAGAIDQETQPVQQKKKWWNRKKKKKITIGCPSF